MGRDDSVGPGQGSGGEDSEASWATVDGASGVVALLWGLTVVVAVTAGCWLVAPGPAGGDWPVSAAAAGSAGAVVAPAGAFSSGAMTPPVRSSSAVGAAVDPSPGCAVVAVGSLPGEEAGSTPAPGVPARFAWAAGTAGARAAGGRGRRTRARAGAGPGAAPGWTPGRGGPRVS